MSETLEQETFKIAFVGSHGVGKTTLCYGLAARLKALDISLDVVGEVARRCPLPINRGTTLAAQSWILHTQIAEETVSATRYDLVICDRSVLDNFVYLLLAAGSRPRWPAFTAVDQLVDSWNDTYDLMVKVPILDQPRADGLRSTDPFFQKAVQDRLDAEIQQRSLNVFDLEGIPRHQWLDHVETEVHARYHPLEQLELP